MNQNTIAGIASNDQKAAVFRSGKGWQCNAGQSIKAHHCPARLELMTTREAKDVIGLDPTDANEFPLHVVDADSDPVISKERRNAAHSRKAGIGRYVWLGS